MSKRQVAAGIVVLILGCAALLCWGPGGCSKESRRAQGYVAAGTGPFSTLTLFSVKHDTDLPPPDHPIAGAVVTILEPDKKKTQATGVSREDGSFYVGSGLIDDTPGYVYILRVQAPGYVPLEVPVVLNHEADVIVTLVPIDQHPIGKGTEPRADVAPGELGGGREPSSESTAAKLQAVYWGRFGEGIKQSTRVEDEDFRYLARLLPFLRAADG
jgi:hypothetical protein